MSACALDHDHLTTTFSKLVDRASLMLAYERSFAEICLVLAQDSDRETAYFACVAALGEARGVKCPSSGHLVETL